MASPIRNDEDAAAQLERRREQDKQLSLAYNRLFKTVDGSLILDNLMNRYGWQDGVEAPSYRLGSSSTDTAARDGMKEPVRYILRMLGKRAFDNPNET